MVDHVVSFPPVVLPVRQISQMCSEAGIPVLVDGAHAVGSLADLRIPSLGVHYYTANLHKWLCTPKGCALLWVAPGVQAGVMPGTISHGHGMGYRGEFIWQGTQDSSAWLAAPACVEMFKALGGSLPGPAAAAAAAAVSHDALLLAACRFALAWHTATCGWQQMAGHLQ